MNIVWDIEATGLLDETAIDYTASPYKLKDDFEIHCVVAIDDDTGEVYEFVQEEVKSKKFRDFFLSATKYIAQNEISYDLLALKLYLEIDYEFTETGFTIEGREAEVFDTLVVSKALNPDRFGGHSIDAWGKRLGHEKIDWRARAIELGLIAYNDPPGAEFKKYHPEMLVYCRRDVEVNRKMYHALLKEIGDWDWADALALEHYVRDIITRQEHRGFKFNVDKAEAAVHDLDEKMEAIRKIVEPLLPPKPMGKTKLKDFIPPKKQFKANGEPSALSFKFVEKHGGSIWEESGKWWYKVYDKQGEMPMPADVPVQTHEPSTVKDITHIKGWLVELGWRPTMYKERDLTVDTKKVKLSQEKFEETVNRYVDQTLLSPFCKDRCEELGTTKFRLRDKLLRHDITRPLKVYTNPTITVGMEKEIDPALLELADQFPHAKLVSEFLTYSHRRNSILGGGVDPDEIDEDDEFAGKGFLAAVRSDGRIPTPADTCGAGTSRFKHKVVANIPRVTSLYGYEMRDQFGVDVRDGFIQLGYDFDSLEAKVEAHYVYKYPGGPEYGVSLTAEKPNDCHSVLARSITGLIGREFPRGTAKNVKYGCSYNAQPPRVAKTVGCDLETAKIIFDAFWTQAAPLKELKDRMQKYWETTGEKKFLMGIDNRKLPIRSKGNVINTAFQSAGVICAKRAMAMHERMMREEGMYVDFFRDDWKNKEFCQQLIAYHDESQLEVRKSLVTWKKFASEEECKAWKSDDGRVWSDPFHNDKGWFRGYCRAGELATIAVRQAGEYYNLNVPLSAGYMLGTSWASCH